GVVMFMSIQVSEFVSDIPAIKHKLEQHFLQIQNWLNDVFGLTFSQQKQYFQSMFSVSDVLSVSSFGSITNGLVYTTLVPIYTFLILLYRPLLLGFLFKLVPAENIGSLETVVLEIKTVIRSY